MNFNFLDHPRVRQAITLFCLSGALACMFSPDYPAFRWWSDQAIYVATGLCLLGLFFLTINKTRLLFVCLGCSAAICFYKNETTNHPMPDHNSLLNPPPHHPSWLHDQQSPASNDSLHPILKQDLPGK
jgi:hypothetical protein